MGLFESIYAPDNYSIETEATELESPLESGQPMLFEEIYFKCNLEPLFEQILREEHLQEMSQTPPYVFAHGLHIAFQRGIKILKDVVKAAINLCKGTGNNPERDPFVMYFSHPNMKTKVSKKVNQNDPQEVEQYIDATIGAYENHFEPLTANKENLKKACMDEIGIEVGIDYKYVSK